MKLVVYRIKHDTHVKTHGKKLSGKKIKQVGAIHKLNSATDIKAPKRNLNFLAGHKYGRPNRNAQQNNETVE